MDKRWGGYGESDPLNARRVRDVKSAQEVKTTVAYVSCDLCKRPKFIEFPCGVVGFYV